LRSFVPGYEVQTPRDLGAALKCTAAEPGAWKPFAGGTDLMVLLEAGKLAHRKFVSIWKLAELRGIEVTSGAVTLGALTTYSEVRYNAIVSREFPLLAHAAAQTGSVATQNRGTLGGNIANASPAADSPPALLVYDAELDLVSVGGSRWVPYHGFWSGYRQIDLRPDEMIRAIRLRRTETPWRHYYRKVGTRRAQAISKVCFAGAADVQSGRVRDIRIALGSVAPVVLRAAKTEDALRGEAITAATVRRAQEILGAEITPIDDMRSSERYRRRIAQNLLAEFCESLSA
jgi:CO/xanthine dehydrogenase FAD-binding subunit